jgi:hypothetical protein
MRLTNSTTRLNVKVNSKAKIGSTKAGCPSGGTSASGNTSSSFTGATEEEVTD